MSAPPAVLCVDAGNSFVKYAVVEGRRAMHLASVPTRRGRLHRAPAALTRSKRRLAGVAGVIVSSVVPSIDRPLARSLTALTSRTPLFVDHAFRFPFRLGVRRPAEVGIDRLCAAAGAAGRGDSTAIIVDVGSAITVDLVLEGAYRGGLILAGPALGLRALGAYAEKLPQIDYSAAPDPFPRLFTGTRASMLRGASEGAVGAIRRAVRALEREAGRSARKVVTGGAAGALAARLPRSWAHQPELVHTGLYRIWRLNTS